jgi:hypothetical protein
MAVENVETSGLDVIVPLFDSTITGQALNAVVIEAINNQTLSNSGLSTTSFDQNSTILSSQPTGTNTIGRGRVK